MKRLLIDVSMVLKACLHASSGKSTARQEEWEGKIVKIPDPETGFNVFLMSLKKTLKDLDMVPSQVIMVKDGYKCKEMRRAIIPGYCVRKPSHPAWMGSFYKAQSMVEELITGCGGLVAHKDGWEADDLIAKMAANMDSIIWSGDKDLLAAGDVYYKGEINPDKFFGLTGKRIQVFKTLVGDPSDKLPGVKGFGEATAIKMMAEFDVDVMDDLAEMFEEGTIRQLEDYVEEFPPFQKIIDQESDVYDTWECVKFHDPGLDIEWRAGYPKGFQNVFPEYDPKEELITKGKLTQQFKEKLQELLWSAPLNSIDIESYTTEEGKKWMEANKNKQGKMPLDVLGQVITGFSITTGPNSNLTYYFPIEHKDTDCISHEDAEEILNMLPDEDTGIPLIVHNSNFELTVFRLLYELRFDRGWLPQLLYDTQIMSGYVDELLPTSLKDNSLSHLGYIQTTYEEVTGGRDMNELTGEEVLSYGCDDTVCTAALYRLFRAVMDYEGSWNCYEPCDVPSQFMYTEKFINGFRPDMEKLEELDEKNEKEFQELYSKIQDHLVTLTWEEEVFPEESKPKRISAEDFLKMKKGELKPEPKKDVKPKKIVHRWPGSVFVPATKLTPKDVKRLYKDYTGWDLKFQVRKLSKIADIIEEQGDYAFADCVRENDLDSLNTLVADAFAPAPELNLQSPKQLCSLMYDFMGLPVRIRGKVTDKMREKGQKEGNPSANEDAFKHAIVYDLQGDSNEKDRELIELLLKAKKTRTMASLYYKPYKNMPHYSDGYIHPQFKISAQKSGRGTASGPNDAQLAKDGELRQVYTPYSDEYLWVSLDFSSQELAHIAWHSQDENMLACFTGDWDDIHSKTGTAIYNQKAEKPMTYEEFLRKKKADEEIKTVRIRKAKPTNFRKTYDGQAAGLAIDLLCSEKDAQALLDAFDEMFPGVQVWIDRMKELHERRGWAVTPMGRIRHIWREITHANKAHVIRGAGNHPIQGGSAEQTKLVLAKLWKEKILEKFDAFFMGTTHDETNFIVHRDDVVGFIEVVHPIMCQRFCDFEIDFRSSIEVGKNYGSLIEIGDEFDAEEIQKVVEEICAT